MLFRREVLVVLLLGFFPGRALAVPAAVVKVGKVVVTHPTARTPAGDAESDTSTEPAARSPRGRPQKNRTDSELMLEAVTAWRGESPNAAKIEKISAEARAEARAEAKRKKLVLSSVWKDPFAEDPERPIPVRPYASKAKTLVSVRRELARARAETATAQADAAVARADAARAQANAAKAEAVAARVQAASAKHEAVAARVACAVPEYAKREALPRAPVSRDGFDSFAPSKRARTARRSRRGFDSNGGFQWASQQTEDGTPSSSASSDEAPVSVASSAAAPSAAGGGILVVPITAWQQRERPR